MGEKESSPVYLTYLYTRTRLENQALAMIPNQDPILVAIAGESDGVIPDNFPMLRQSSEKKRVNYPVAPIFPFLQLSF